MLHQQELFEGEGKFVVYVAVNDGILLMVQCLTKEARGQVHHQSTEGREQRGGDAHE